MFCSMSLVPRYAICFPVHYRLKA